MARPAGFVSLKSAIESLHGIAAAVERLPKFIHKGGKPPSDRAREKQLVRSARAGGGVARAQILDEVSAHCLLICGHTVLLIRAVNDCLIAARTRDDRVNGPALAIAARALVETAAMVAWLVDPGIGGPERGRRYLAWKFSELRNDRSLTADMNDLRPEFVAARAQQGAQEVHLFKQAAAAKWRAQASVVQPDNKIQAATLLQLTGTKGQSHPSITDLVKAMLPGNVYQLLSIAAHGRYSGIIAGTTPQGDPDKDGGTTVGMAGFGITPSMALFTVINSVTASTRQLAIWNGVSVAQLDRALRLAYQVAGQTPMTV